MCNTHLCNCFTVRILHVITALGQSSQAGQLGGGLNLGGGLGGGGLGTGLGTSGLGGLGMGQNTLGGGGPGLLSTGGGLGMGQTQLGTGKHILVLCIWCKVGYLVLFSDPVWIVVGFICIMLAMTQK